MDDRAYDGKNEWLLNRMRRQFQSFYREILSETLVVTKRSIKTGEMLVLTDKGVRKKHKILYLQENLLKMTKAFCHK